MKLIREPNLPDPDAALDLILAAHRGLGPEASRAIDARLVLILANHIGDPEVLEEALRLASE